MLQQEIGTKCFGSWPGERIQTIVRLTAISKNDSEGRVYYEGVTNDGCILSWHTNKRVADIDCVLQIGNKYNVRANIRSFNEPKSEKRITYLKSVRLWS